MSHLILTHEQNPDFMPSSYRSSPVALKIQMGPVTAVILMIILISFMGLISLTHLNSMSTKGYVYSKLEDDYNRLVEDGEINEMLILQARSIQNIQSTRYVAGMVKPDRIVYVEGFTGVANVEP